MGGDDGGGEDYRCIAIAESTPPASPRTTHTNTNMRAANGRSHSLVFERVGGTTPSTATSKRTLRLAR
jgi:hypothetical protein